MMQTIILRGKNTVISEQAWCQSHFLPINVDLPGFFFWIHVFGIIKSEKEMNSVSCYFMWLYFKDCFQILLHIPLIDTSKKYSHFISYLIKHAKGLKSVRRQDRVVVLVLQIFLIAEKAINTYLLQASGEWMDIHKDLLKTYIHKNPGNICAAQLDLSMPPLTPPFWKQHVLIMQSRLHA